MKSLMTCICFDNQAEQAVQFYASIFKSDLVIEGKSICGKDEYGGPEGSVRTVAFRLFNQPILAVNGGDHFKFTDAMSMVVACDTQEEIDYYWEKLSAGGEKIVCGWLKDKFGVSWQVTPNVVEKMMLDPDQKKSQRVMQEVLKMTKIEIAPLLKAYQG